ncbi:hypothetical protein ACWIW6_02165 [Ursidibacter sp. B-7004-1]
MTTKIRSEKCPCLALPCLALPCLNDNCKQKNVKISENPTAYIAYFGGLNG